MPAGQNDSGRNANAASPAVQVLAGHHDWIVACFIDVLPQEVATGQPFELGGVVVLSRTAPAGLTLQLEGKGRVMSVEWDLQSPVMGKRYQQGANSTHARFRIRGVQFLPDDDNLSLMLSRANGERLTMAEVSRSTPRDYSRIFVEPLDRLIFDVGANDGSDTWYYLCKGFRVVAVEAIPELAQRLLDTFRAQVTAQRLIVEPVAVAEQDGEVSFTVNRDRTEWSSAHGASKAVTGASTAITVPSTTLARLFARHGSPYYLKIDIEGGELSAIGSLQSVPPDQLPSFLSFEINPDWSEILEHLYQMGYRRFQLVRQGARFLSRPMVPSREGLECNCRFTDQMSGPFGRDLPEDRWTGLVDVIRHILQGHAEAQDRKIKGENPAWFDVHAARRVL
jgi:FkbM family methyltransferase